MNDIGIAVLPNARETSFHNRRKITIIIIVHVYMFIVEPHCVLIRKIPYDHLLKPV